MPACVFSKLLLLFLLQNYNNYNYNERTYRQVDALFPNHR